ncbi:methyltransferase domain-containing protein [Candidatus Gottesmanbacteria bacterium]|nr:methyltransferase domain-containing protein [Candidatus Gottesmanbacteria bacterium]
MKLRGGLLPKKSTFHSFVHGPIDLFQFAGKNTLRAGGVTHSGGFTYDMWKKAITIIQNSKFKIQKCLILGIGGGTVVYFLERAFPNIEIIAVDIDPKMIEIARTEFNIQGNLICADAIEWIKKQRQKFNLVIVDLYIGRRNPQKARTLTFLRHIKKRLKSRGKVLYNSQFFSEDPKEFEAFLSRCKEIFGTIHILQEFPMSRLILLSG